MPIIEPVMHIGIGTMLLLLGAVGFFVTPVTTMNLSIAVISSGVGLLTIIFRLGDLMKLEPPVVEA